MIRETRKHWMRAAMKMVGVQPKELISESVSQSKSVSESLPFQVRGQFLRSLEADLYHHLDEAVGDRAIVCPKVRAQDVLLVPNASERIEAAVRIDRKCVDFLVCERDTRRPVCAIQLDLSAPGSVSGRDDFLEKALAAAGLLVLHVRADRVPSIQMIRERIYPLLSGRTIRRRDVGSGTKGKNVPAKPATPPKRKSSTSPKLGG